MDFSPWYSSLQYANPQFVNPQISQLETAYITWVLSSRFDVQAPILWVNVDICGRKAYIWAFKINCHFPNTFYGLYQKKTHTHTGLVLLDPELILIKYPCLSGYLLYGQDFHGPKCPDSQWLTVNKKCIFIFINRF